MCMFSVCVRAHTHAHAHALAYTWCEVSEFVKERACVT